MAFAVNTIIMITLSCFLRSWTTGEVFTSISHLKKLVEVETTLVDYLGKFISEEQKRLDRISTVYNATEQLLGLNFASKQEAERYVGNPIQCYRMLRRFIQFGSVEELISIDFTRALVQNLRHHDNLFPNEDDFKGAQAALVRLQQTYDLPPATISDGIVPDVPSTTRMSADDTFSIGKESYLKQDFVECELWMGETLRLLDIGRTQSSAPSRFEVLDYLAYSEYAIGKIESAINHTLEMLRIDPQNERIKKNLAHFQENLKSKRAAKRLENNISRKAEAKDKLNNKATKRRHYPTFYYTEDEDHYQRYLLEKVAAKRLCRGDTKPIPKRLHHRLICWYRASHPQLVLKPAKIERVFTNPDVLLFRKVLSDNEVQRIKELALPMLNRATVHNPTTGRIEFANYRISKSAWLDNSHDPLVQKVDQRIGIMTNLNMETAESLQIANYGIGGHYDTHFDFSRLTPIRRPPWRRQAGDITYRIGASENRPADKNGNRIATFLIYLSDVKMGGGTVFTNIHMQIKPSKGDAVFWHNLHDDGTGDYNTRHAACPVLLGEKWVANKWIHERGQEFRRPCPLDRYSSEKS